ncbi:MAG: hypothetical protein ACOX9B_14185 [Candidatus Xenobium sp.]|nr:hypothetical protein [Burkholderiales bacterium]
MAWFYETNPFVVQPEKESSGRTNQWNILNPGGIKLARIFHAPDSLLVRAMRGVGLVAQYPARITIQDMQEEPLLSFRKNFTFGMFRARVYDQGGLLGTVIEQKLGLEGRQYILQDAGGTMRGLLEGDWRAYNLQMKDARGSILGKISRKADHLNKVIFSSDSPFYVVHLYVDQEDQAWRRLLLGTSAAIALLLR